MKKKTLSLFELAEEGGKEMNKRETDEYDVVRILGFVRCGMIPLAYIIATGFGWI